MKDQADMDTIVRQIDEAQEGLTDIQLVEQVMRLKANAQLARATLKRAEGQLAYRLAAMGQLALQVEDYVVTARPRQQVEFDRTLLLDLQDLVDDSDLWSAVLLFPNARQLKAIGELSGQDARAKIARATVTSEAGGVTVTIREIKRR